MKQGLLLTFLALSLFITSCGSDDDTDGNWSKSAEYSGSGRGGAVSFTIGDDVYLGLGYSNGDYFSSFYKYNTSSNNWLTITETDTDRNIIGNFPGTPRREAVAFSINGKGYIGTGVDEDGDRLNDFWEYDPSKDVADRWTEVTSQFPGTVRQSAVAFAFDTDADGINDVAYVGTGYGYLDGEDYNSLKDFYKFENGAWDNSYISSYSGNKTYQATTFIIGTKAYLVSGISNLDNVWEFDGLTATWTQKDDIDDDHHAENVQRSKAVAFVIDGRGYITTGSGSDTREIWEYDPEDDDWVEQNDLETEVPSRIDGIGFNIDGKGFIATGTYGSTGLSDMWRFEPNVKEDDDDND